MPDFRTEHKNDFAHTWEEIARAIGAKHGASAKWIYEKALRKLRKRYTREEIRRMYEVME